MNIYCTSRGTVDYKKPLSGVRKIKETGFEGIFLDFEKYKDEKFPLEQAYGNVLSACEEMRVNTNISDCILLKNKFQEFNGHLIRGENCDGIETARKIDEMNRDAGFEKYGFCLDVGVCNICGQNMYDYICALGNRIKAVILRDNNGDSDSALLPYSSITTGGSHTDWLNLIKGLRAVDFDGTLIMNFSDSFTALPIQLKDSYLRYAYEMAKYFVWQISMERMIKKYDTRVLFGAGNMCRAYMKCYGDEYRPLFTCDNNKSIWGTSFEGLEVKNPEELKSLPEDCAIFICNIYYEEIESQLRQMDLPNPIEWFNDEYMPSFYFQRIDADTRKIIEN